MNLKQKHIIYYPGVEQQSLISRLDDFKIMMSQNLCDWRRI